jgi:hypothetical protein
MAQVEMKGAKAAKPFPKIPMRFQNELKRSEIRGPTQGQAARRETSVTK